MCTPTSRAATHLARQVFVRSLRARKERPPTVDQQCKLLFPGQGSQYVGMTSKLPTTPAVERVFSAASDVLEYDLRALCVGGPQQELDKTVHCQPAVVVASLAASLECFKSHSAAEEPLLLPKDLAQKCEAVAGFSVGEFSALIFAGALPLQAGLELVHLRGLAMQEACQEQDSGMLTVVGLKEETLQSLCQEAQQHNLGLACIANFMFPNGFVVGGTKGALRYVRDKAKERGASSVKAIQVSGAFHSPLMKSAVPKLESALRSAPLRLPAITVYSNVTGKPYSSVEEIRQLLAEQVVRPVQWLSTINNMIGAHGVEGFAEVGPGKQLKSILGRINKTAYKKCVNHEA